MKLKRKIFSKNILIFLFFIFFAGGVAFAGAGKIKPAAEETINLIWNGTNWTLNVDTDSDGNLDMPSWLDQNDENVTEPDGTDDIIALCTMNESITLTLGADLSISKLFVFGGKECIINLNEFSLSIEDTLYLGSSWDISNDIDGGIIANTNGNHIEGNKLGYLTVEGTGSVDVNNMDTTTWRYDGDALQNPILNVDQSVTPFVVENWNLGSTSTTIGGTKGSVVPDLKGDGAKNVTIENYTTEGDADSLKVDFVFELIKENNTSVEIIDYIWTGLAGDRNWKTAENWTNNNLPENSVTVIIPKCNNNNYPEISESIEGFSGNIQLFDEATLTIKENGKIIINSLTFSKNVSIEENGELQCKTINFQNKNSKITVNGTLIITKDSTVDYFTIDSHFDSNSTGKIYCSDKVNHLVIATTFSNLNSIEKNGGDITIFQNVKCESINANSIIIQKDTAPTVEFDSITATSLQNGGDLTVNSELQVSSIINQHKLTIANSVTAINQLSSILNDAELILNVDTSVEEITNNQNGIITVAEGKYLVVSKNMKDIGTFDGKVKFSGSEEQSITLNENTNYPHIVVDKDGGKITFTNAMTVGLFETEKSPETVFESNVSVGTFTDKADSGTYIFNKNASFATETIFNTTGFVSFGSEENSTITFESTDNYVSFTHTAGKTLITGNLSANDVTLSETSINGTVNANDINCGNTTIAGNVTANNITLAEITVVENSKLKINETSTDGKITLKGNILSTDLKNLTLDGNVIASDQCYSINLGTLESKGTFTAQNDLEIDAVSTFEKNVEAKENLTITGESVFKDAVKAGENLKITGNVTFESTEKSVEVGNNLTITGEEITINGAAIAGKSDPFTEGSILLTGTTKITANSLSATKDITLNANVIETADLIAKNITIQGTTIKNAALIATENVFINKDSEVLEQTLNITGDVSSNNFEAVAKIQTFDGTISVDNDFSCKGTQLNFAKVVTAKNMNLSGDEITFAGKVTVNQNAQIQNTGLLKISDFVYGKSFVQKGSESEIGQVMISGSFVQSGESENPTATFGSNVYFYNLSHNSLDITIGSDKSSITINGNLIIAKSKENDVVIKGTVKSKNFALFSGNVDLSGNLSTEKDVVILGENYSLKDDQTGIENLYSYTENRPGHWSQASYSFETELPNGTKLPDGTESNRFSGKVNVLSGKSITVGKNLYANGTVFALSGVQGSGKWKLNVPDTSVAANAFCEVYNSEVSDCDAAYQIAALQCTDKSGNINWAFDDETGTVKITKAYSVSDNVIRVEFNKPVRILKDRFTQKQMRFSNGPDENHYFENVYLDEKCTKEALEIVNQYYEENGSKNYYVYVKANSKWNTDATGTFVGEEKSTDYDGVHHNTTICLDFPRAIVATTQSGQNFFSYIITDLWGKRLTNYSVRTTSGTQKTSFENVEDKTGPVLISVKTGQENHTEYDGTKGAQSQPSYDSHNFIEFVYSEFVNFGTEPAENAAENPDGAEEVFLKADDQGIENAKNIQVTQKFGALQNEDITQSGQLKFAGLAKIQNGKIYTGSQNNQGNADKYVNALYRFDKYSLRYSIAGYTHPTEFVQDAQGNNHKKWIGYIQEAELPTGTVSMICDGKNDLVFDMAGNSQTLVKNNLTVDSSKSGVYGNWDISKPTFATLRANFQEEWQENTYFEAIGNNFGAGSTLDRIEFHFFDNTPNYNTTDPAVWVTEHGWVVNDFTKEQLVLPDSYCADNFGGSRPFHAQKEFRTTGGLRFSSVQNISQSFLYTTNDTEEPSISFNNSMQTIIGANAKIFTGSSSTRRPTNNYDGLYISLMLQDTSLNVKTTFLVSYNNQNSYITDLAGNRLLSKTIHTIDRTSPSIGIILSPISQKDFYIVFVKKINQNTVKLVDNEENKIEIPETFLELLPQCFEIIKIQKDGTYTLSDIQIDTSVYATEIPLNDSENFTAFKMTLNRDVTFEDIKSLHFKIKNPQKYDFLMTDPVTNIKDSYVTLIQDKLGNYIDINQCHAFSDVAINSVVPLYAYNSALNEVIEEDGKKKVNIFDGLYNEEHFAVRDWNKDQQNYGTLFSQQEISIVVDSISKENAVKNKLKIYLSNSPDEESVSKAFNEKLCGSLRIWFPNVMENPISIFSVNNNQNFQTVSSTFVNNNNCADGLKFLLPLEMTNQWSAQDQVSFLFSYVNNDNSDLIIYPSPIFDIDKKVYDLQKSAKFPLFAIRMENPQDITTLDLWSFRLKNLTEQRGGVSILNNVINATYGEKAVVKVNVPQDSNVDVIVMTLDGNIVTYLQHGAISSGEHYFTWNGTNMSGTKVARGLYFVRVIGPNFDETRKVMVVKD